MRPDGAGGFGRAAGMVFIRNTHGSRVSAGAPDRDNGPGAAGRRVPSRTTQTLSINKERFTR